MYKRKDVQRQVRGLVEESLQRRGERIEEGRDVERIGRKHGNGHEEKDEKGAESYESGGEGPIDKEWENRIRSRGPGRERTGYATNLGGGQRTG